MCLCAPFLGGGGGEGVFLVFSPGDCFQVKSREATYHTKLQFCQRVFSALAFDRNSGDVIDSLKSLIASVIT